MLHSSTVPSIISFLYLTNFPTSFQFLHKTLHSPTCKLKSGLPMNFPYSSWDWEIHSLSSNIKRLKGGEVMEEPCISLAPQSSPCHYSFVLKWNSPFWSLSASLAALQLGVSKTVCRTNYGQRLAFVSAVLLEHSLSHSVTRRLWLLCTTAQASHPNRDHMATKPQYLLFCHLQNVKPGSSLFICTPPGQFFTLPFILKKPKSSDE